MQSPRKGDVQAIGQEGDEDVRLDTGLELVKDRPDGKVAFEILERLLDRDQQQVVAPQLGRVFLDYNSLPNDGPTFIQRLQPPNNGPS